MLGKIDFASTRRPVRRRRPRTATGTAKFRQLESKTAAVEHDIRPISAKELILKVLSPDLAPIAEVFDHPEDPMTTRELLQHWYDEQKAEAVKQGHKKGLKEGRVEGQRSVLAKQLQLKFGSLDVTAEARLADATPAQLDRWTERVLTAGSLEQIWD